MASDATLGILAPPAVARRRPEARYFYVWLALANAALAFGGFASTYWMQLPAGTFVGNPLLHLHAALFSAWGVLLLSQTMLAARSRLNHHRAWGLVGISLATAMVFTGMAVAIDTLTTGLAAGYGDRSLAFSILPIGTIAIFVGFFIAAIANINRPDWHKRFMFVATVSLLQAAIGRVFFTLLTGGGPGLRPGLGAPLPLGITVPGGLIIDLLIVAGIIYDWRTRGRPHNAWLIGLGVMLAFQLLRASASETSAWLAVARALAAFG